MIDKRIDPIKASENIRETYLRYLITTFGLKNKELARQFQDIARNSEGLFRGPILEATPKYKKGKSVLDIITEKKSILTQEFINYAPGLDKKSLADRLSLERELYSHQENALRKIIGQNRNVVVATGTGSGKTECFLFPIIDYLLKERANKRLGSGVRALLLYPMNALANDQVRRLRHLLPPETGITFGRYTGQTEQGFDQGLESFKQENADQEPQANELFCRDQILGIEPVRKQRNQKNYSELLGPPHILLTNFAMLEYLLMRPRDSVLFDQGAGDTWRFLVLDEAHVYSGALGTEIGYLIRRLKDRICRSQQGKILCIATSATIGADSADSKKTIAESFQNLFGEKFDEQDVITGQVISPKEFLKDFENWGKGSHKFYNALDTLIKSDCNSISLLSEYIQNHILSKSSSGFPDKKTLHRAIQAIKDSKESEHAKEMLLYHLLAGDESLRFLIQELENQPIDLQKAVQKIWDTTENADMDALKKSLIQLVDLGSKARLTQDSAPLLAARYHFFVRSLEGLSICLVKSQDKGSSVFPKLIIGRHREVPDAPNGIAVAFELQACGRCGQSFLHGHYLDDGRFASYIQRTRLDEERKKSVYLSIDLDQVVDSAEDEDPLRDEKPPVSGEDEEIGGKVSQIGRTNLGDIQYLCARCGFIGENKSLACEYCRKHHSRTSYEWIDFRQVSPESGNVVKVCPACGAQKHFGGSIIRAFSPGDDAAGAVLSHALMTDIPLTSEKTEIQKSEEQKPKGRFAIVTPKKSIDISGGKRRLLAFSDSRQDAAFFATYLSRTANQILHRQLILKAIQRLFKENPGTEFFSPNELINPLIMESQEIGLFGIQDTEITRKSEVSKWISAELAGIQRRYGLEGVGLITWELKYRQNLLKIIKIDDFCLNAEEFVTLLEIFLTELRKRNVLYSPNITPKDTYFWPRNRPYTIRPNHVNSKLSIASWHPQASRNIRSDFLEKLFERMEINVDKQIREDVLDYLWQLSLNLPIWKEVNPVNKLWGGHGNDGAAWQLRWDAWRGRLNSPDKENIIYKCDTCGNISHLNLKTVCPSYRCPGKLEPVDPNIEFADNHYRYLYVGKPISIDVLEHTAQITTKEGAKRQRNFTDDEKPLNILSCSTTFELGVDVGQLHAVFLRNVPPTVANYVQRSGRAGRRLSAAAFVLTFCRSRPHDLGYFDVVNKLISGKVQSPMIRTDNIRIARRHLHSVTLSRLWRFHHPELFNGTENKYRGIVKWLFFEVSGSQLIYDWLQQKPHELYDEITRIFPSDMRIELGFDSWRWTNELVTKPQNNEDEILWEGRLGLAQTELISEDEEYKKIQTEIPELYNYSKAQKKRIREQQILDFLASRNVLPKYGFPVDVVPLKLQSTDDWAQRIELNRDLKLALSEYAPGCTLVANGRVIKSYALERIKGKAWPEYRFAICSHCGKFNRAETAHGTIENCECGLSLDGSKSTIYEGIFVKPIYGFRTQIHEDGQEPVEIRPQRTFSTPVYFSHYQVSHEKEPFFPEGNPDPRMGIQIQKRYSRDGVLVVLNPGRMKRGFWLCPFCGYGDTIVAASPKTHKTPWGAPCNGKLRTAFLGHEFQSDVLEIRFTGVSSDKYDQGFWLSFTAAILAGAAKALDIERDDIDGTVLRFGGDYCAVVLFDNVPGGAGHVRRVSDNLEKVMEEAFNISENCLGCSRDQSCNTCLRNYYNQYAHDLLKRGPVADFLSKILSGLYRQEQNGYFSLGLTDSGRWFEQQMRTSHKIDIILDQIPVPSSGLTHERDWYQIIHDAAIKESSVRLFIRQNLKQFSKTSSLEKVSLHSLAILTQFPNVEIFTVSDDEKYQAKMYLESSSNAYTVRWTSDKNPFAEPSDIELSVLQSFIQKVREDFNNLAQKSSNHKWNFHQIDELLQGTKVIHIKRGTTQSWEDILSQYLPNSIMEVKIYDRYIRNAYQFKSLEMFIEAIKQKASSNGINIEITTTGEEKTDIQNQFRKIQNNFKDKNVKIKYEISEPAKEMPHYRKVQIKSEKENCSLWLDKGLDIYKFDNLNQALFKTLETYLVIENS